MAGAPHAAPPGPVVFHGDFPSYRSTEGNLFLSKRNLVQTVEKPHVLSEKTSPRGEADQRVVFAFCGVTQGVGTRECASEPKFFDKMCLGNA